MVFLQFLYDCDEHLISLYVFIALLLDSNSIEMMDVFESFSQFDNWLLFFTQVHEPTIVVRLIIIFCVDLRTSAFRVLVLSIFVYLSFWSGVCVRIAVDVAVILHLRSHSTAADFRV